jgi:hypothetical protein
MALPDDNDENDEEQMECEDAMYNKLDETKDIEVAHGYVTFTQSFCYLGSMVAYNLCNDDNVMMQIVAWPRHPWGLSKKSGGINTSTPTANTSFFVQSQVIFCCGAVKHGHGGKAFLTS